MKEQAPLPEEPSSPQPLPWFLAADPLPPKLMQMVRNQTRTVLRRSAQGHLPWEAHPDADAVYSHGVEIATQCCLEAANLNEAIRFYNRRKRRMAYDRRHNILSDSIFSFTDYQLAKIRSIYARAEELYPNDPNKQQAARQHMVDQLTMNMQAAWQAYHSNVISLNEPSSLTASDHSGSMEEVIADPATAVPDSEVRHFINHLLADAGLGDEHQLIATIWFDDGEPATQRETMQRYNELTGSTMSLGTVNSRISDIKVVLEEWGNAYRRLSKDNDRQRV